MILSIIKNYSSSVLRETSKLLEYIHQINVYLTKEYNGFRLRLSRPSRTIHTKIAGLNDRNIIYLSHFHLHFELHPTANNNWAPSQCTAAMPEVIRPFLLHTCSASWTIPLITFTYTYTPFNPRRKGLIDLGYPSFVINDHDELVTALPSGWCGECMMIDDWWCCSLGFINLKSEHKATEWSPYCILRLQYFKRRFWLRMKSPRRKLKIPKEELRRVQQTLWLNKMQTLWGPGLSNVRWCCFNQSIRSEIRVGKISKKQIYYILYVIWQWDAFESRRRTANLPGQGSFHQCGERRLYSLWDASCTSLCFDGIKCRYTLWYLLGCIWYLILYSKS